MFSLIITIISIALVAALALATLYYGGNAFNQGAARAEASKILNQGQQLMGAADLFIAREGRVPTLQELLDGGYLKSVPQAALALQTANAADTPWTMPVPGQVVFIMPAVDQAVCQEVNADLLGFNGILEEARTQLVSQCYGPENSYKVVFAKSAPVLRAAADQDLPALPQATVVDTAVPDASDTDAWVVEPGLIVAGGTGGGTGGGDTGDGGDGGDTVLEAGIVLSPSNLEEVDSGYSVPFNRYILNFGSSPRDTFIQRTITVTATGNSASEVFARGKESGYGNDLVITGGTCYPADFDVDSYPEGFIPFTLQPGESCTLSLRVFGDSILGVGTERNIGSLYFRSRNVADSFDAEDDGMVFRGTLN